MDVKVVYTVSSKGNMIRDIMNSLRSLRRFVGRSNIIVFYTPPRNELDYEQMAKFAVVKKVENLTEPFALAKKSAPSRYGEKIHLCDVDSPNVIFLDADTIVKKDIRHLLEGDFDFSARSGKIHVRLNQSIWTEMFQKVGKQPIPMPNAGFMIFKNSCHREIKKEWLKYVNDPNLPNPHPVLNFKEQYALALAVSGKRIKWMSGNEHAFKWESMSVQDYTDTYVIHYWKYGRLRLGDEKELLRKYWNRRAEESDEFRRVCTLSSPSFNKFLHATQMKTFLRLLNNIDSVKNKKILQIGCGTGKYSILVRIENANYVAIDLSKKTLKLAKIGYQNYDFINSYASVIPLRHNVFDMIFSITVLHRIFRPLQSKTIKEMFRLVKPTGYLVIIEDTKDEITKLKDMFAHELNCRTLLTVHDKYYKSVIKNITKFSIGRRIIRIMDEINILFFILLFIEKITSIILPSKHAYGLGILLQKR